ncbi:MULTISPECIES: hypothetical protein [Halorussus]|uniref:hypothetical protein n=1 Tax=Halorussus TaxID=1070314 RepID=UPI00209FDA17|nr:hypothetical protein [Halorussus vallis]USZ78016.1 hypothetical protein NGM07_20350 [Halorussus vallis]
MRRREFLLASGLAAATALAGCSGNAAPPPRKSNVVSNVETTDTALRIDLADQAWVMSRYDGGGSQSLADPDDVGGFGPVGVAGAKGKGGGGGRGATGRGTGGYSKAPRTHHGRAWFHGGGYADDWYENHSDEVSKYPVAVAALGVAYLGSSFAFQDDKPGPGPVNWDEVYRNPDDAVKHPISQDGWYRVGTRIEGEKSGHDFRWESIDLEVKDAGSGYEIGEEWKVSPRI